MGSLDTFPRLAWWSAYVATCRFWIDLAGRRGSTLWDLSHEGIFLDCHSLSGARRPRRARPLTRSTRDAIEVRGREARLRGARRRIALAPDAAAKIIGRASLMRGGAQ